MAQGGKTVAVSIPTADDLTAAVTSTLSGVAGGVGVLGAGLFERPGPVYRGQFVISDDARPPGSALVFRPGKPVDAIIRFASAEDSAGQSAVRTVCIKLPDFYGPKHDQDFLLASSADGIPFHHAALPAAAPGDPIYSSLWLYLAGLQPVVFGLRAEQLNHEGEVGRGDRFAFLAAGMLSRFKSVGTIDIGDEIPDATTEFAASNAGGGLRPLPPASFYHS